VREAVAIHGVAVIATPGLLVAQGRDPGNVRRAPYDFWIASSP
jgi:hypothetical protein